MSAYRFDRTGEGFATRHLLGDLQPARRGVLRCARPRRELRLQARAPVRARRHDVDERGLVHRRRAHRSHREVRQADGAVRRRLLPPHAWCLHALQSDSDREDPPGDEAALEASCAASRPREAAMAVGRAVRRGCSPRAWRASRRAVDRGRCDDGGCRRHDRGADDDSRSDTRRRSRRRRRRADDDGRADDDCRPDDDPPATTTVAPTTTIPGCRSRHARARRGGRRGRSSCNSGCIELHFDPGAPDGMFDTSMTQVRVGVPEARGRARRRQVTPELWLRMQQPFVPKPFVDGGEPDRVEIDLPRQVLIAYKGGTVALITHISTGRSARWPTPGGEYAFTWRWNGWRTSRLGRLYNPVYFNRGIAVHGAPEVPEQAGVTRLRAHPHAHRRSTSPTSSCGRARVRAGRLPRVHVAAPDAGSLMG